MGFAIGQKQDAVEPQGGREDGDGPVGVAGEIGLRPDLFQRGDDDGGKEKGPAPPSARNPPAWSRSTLIATLPMRIVTSVKVRIAPELEGAGGGLVRLLAAAASSRRRLRLKTGDVRPGKQGRLRDAGKRMPQPDKRVVHEISYPFRSNRELGHRCRLQDRHARPPGLPGTRVHRSPAHHFTPAPNPVVTAALPLK